MEPADRAGIRTALATGARFTTVIPNLRKDLSPFLNLLDLRTLEVGRKNDRGISRKNRGNPQNVQLAR